MNSVNFLNLSYIYLRIYDFFRNFDYIYAINLILYFIRSLIPISIVLTLFLFIVIFYSKSKLMELDKKDKEKLEALKAKNTKVEPTADDELNKKWQEVQTHMSSNSSSDWRMAIMEADIMLNDILDKHGYQGDSIGDKLKSADKSDFLTLDSAWEAHKIRNQIAHEGTNFLLNERDAKRVIELYKSVFDEFYHI